MARLHTGHRGKSGSTKPISKNTPNWLAYKASEIEEIIVKLAKEGHSSAKIGLILRDSYGVPDIKKATKKKITKIIKDAGLASAEPEDLTNLKTRAKIVAAHIKNNHKDNVSKRGLQLIQSKIRRLEKYYKKTGAIERKKKR